MLSTPCLWLIGVTLFLPSVRGCHEMQSPAQLMAEDPLRNVFWLSPFLVAELLAILTLIPLLKKVEPSWRIWGLSLATVIPAFGSPAFFLVIVEREKPLFQWYAAGAALSVGLALALIVSGARKRGWPRHVHLLAAFTSLTLPLATFAAQIFIMDGPKAVSIGAYTFVAATAGLTLLTGSTLRAITRA